MNAIPQDGKPPVSARAARIRGALEAAFSPEFLEVRDDSGKHAGHAGARPGGETHFHVQIGAEPLKGLTRVAAHRRIHEVLASEFSTGLHALSIELVS